MIHNGLPSADGFMYSRMRVHPCRRSLSAFSSHTPLFKNISAMFSPCALPSLLPIPRLCHISGEATVYSICSLPDNSTILRATSEAFVWLIYSSRYVYTRISSTACQYTAHGSLYPQSMEQNLNQWLGILNGSTVCVSLRHSRKYCPANTSQLPCKKASRCSSGRLSSVSTYSGLDSISA
ncbi:hypothetical protein D3C81_1424070 [compost metagenome]